MRAAVDAVAATPANRADDDTGCNEDPSTCASPAAVTATSSPPVGRGAGPLLSGVVAYFSSSLDNKDKDKDNNDAFNDGNVVRREVGRR